MKKEIRLKKIPLKLFIETLVEIYERGADFVDIIGEPDAEQDSLTIVVTESYFFNDEEDAPKTTSTTTTTLYSFLLKDDSAKEPGLTDEDLNQLL